MKGLLRRVTLVGITVALAGAADARAEALECGQVVTTGVTLDASLTGCETGLVVGADGVTIDLNGYSIEGTGGPGAGVAVWGRSDVVVRNGAIRGFGTGVSLVDPRSVTVTGLEIEEADRGVAIGATFDPPGEVTGVAITRNVVRNAGDAFACHGNREYGERIYLAENHFTSNRSGITLFYCSADLIQNNVSHNSADGISRFRSSGLVERNAANGNGRDGIYSHDSHGAFLRNVTNGNGDNGLRIHDGSPDHGPFHTVERHIANANAHYGILAPLDGVIDGGRNRAHANGEAVACLGITCNKQG